jgi:hypothetical protein
MNNECREHAFSLKTFQPQGEERGYNTGPLKADPETKKSIKKVATNQPRRNYSGRPEENLDVLGLRGKKKTPQDPDLE